MNQMGSESTSEEATSTWRLRYRVDVFALVAFFVMVVIILSHRFLHDRWLTEYDIMTYFLPWYGELGDRLRGFDIPGWTSWLSSGAPAAGDPSGGWMYLPVMLTFSLLDPASAFKVMILLQVLIGGTAIYMLSRMLHLVPLAALMSTTAFVFGPFLAAQTSHGTVAGQASTWIPVALIGVEASLRAAHMLHRVLWWSLTGLAISQIAVSWPGQGLLNALLIIAAWVVYRTLLSPPVAGLSFRRRLRYCLTTGPAVMLIGLLLGAAGLLPRLSINAASNIPGGNYSDVVGGTYLATPHTFLSLLRDTLVDDTHFRPVALSTSVVVLAMVGVLIGRGRYGVPFFAFVTVVAAVLTLDETPLHRLMYMLPEFEAIHSHSPRRILWVCSFAPAMLAGAGVQVLLQWRPRLWTMPVVLVPLAVIVAAADALNDNGDPIGRWPIAIASIATALTLALVVGVSRRTTPHGRSHDLGSVAAAAMIVLVLLYPVGIDRFTEADRPDQCETSSEGRSPQQVLAIYLSRTDPGGAGAFLQEQQARGEPFRFVGFAGRDPATDDVSYNFARCDPSVLALGINGRASRLGLEMMQGYNPLHLRVYHEYIDVMNGGQQDYHWTDPFPHVLESSPLLDMLNVRYIVVALYLPDSRDNSRDIAAGRIEVFRNDDVVVYENRDAFPRAWIVHDVRPNNDGDGLRQIAEGNIDPREVAFVDGPLPTIDPDQASASTSTDRVVITNRSGDHLSADVVARAPGLAVFSEIFEEGWSAWVDGERVDVLRTNHALRGVPVAAGEHTVELRYEPASLRLGLWITGVSSATISGLAFIALRRGIAMPR